VVQPLRLELDDNERAGLQRSAEVLQTTIRDVERT
jgi:hypothetical protein